MLGCASLQGTERVAVTPEKVRESRPLELASPDSAASMFYIEGQLDLLDGREVEALRAFEQAAVFDPDSEVLAARLREARRRAVGQLIASNQLAEAVGVLEALRASNEIEPEGMLALFTLYSQLGRDADAEQIGRSLVAERPDAMEGYVVLGSLYEAQGRAEEAEAAYRSGFERVPEDPRTYDVMARMFRARGQTDSEIRILRKKLEVQEGDPDALERLTEIYSNRGDIDGVIGVFEDVVKFNPDNVRALFQLGWLYAQANRREEAIESFELVVDQLEDGDEKARTRLVLGQLHRQNGDLDDAVRELRKIGERSESFVEAGVLIAQVLEEQGKLDQSLAVANDLAKKTDNVEVKTILAGMMQRAGDMPGAVALMERLASENPDRAGDLYYRLGLLYTNRGDEDLAMRSMLRALEVEGDNPNALNFVGYTWADQGVRLEEAYDMIRRAVEKRPQDGFIVDSLGWVLYKRGLEQSKAGRLGEARASFDDAREKLERAQELLDPDDPTIERHLGDVYRTMGEPSRALEAYRRALGLGAADDDADEIRREIKALESELEGSGARD